MFALEIMKLLLQISDQSIELKVFFQSQNIECEVTKNTEEASEKLSLYQYDCVVLEIDSAESKTFQLLKSCAEENKSEGLIALSNNSTLENKVDILNAGADDFLPIPFQFEELLARIRAVIRRKRFDTRTKLYLGNLVVDLLQNTALAWDKDLNLTKKEYELLLFLIANKTRTLTKTTLSEYLWGDEADNMDSYNLLFAHIKNLRKKLHQSKTELEIKNVYGVGYQIIEL